MNDHIDELITYARVIMKEAGVGQVEALKIAAEVQRNMILEEHLQEIRQEIEYLNLK